MTPLATTETQRTLDGTAQVAVTGLMQITDAVQGVHRAIAAIPFTILKPLPGVGTTAFTHDTIADGVYDAVRTVMRGVGEGARLVIKSIPPEYLPDREAPAPWSGQAISALNGAFGDRLAEHGNALTLGMAFAHKGRALPLDEAAWAAAHPQATGKVAVFIHGLCCNESVWDLHRPDHDGHNYAERLAVEGGFTPLFVRYNSGLGMADNGAALAQLLDGLMEVYPRRIQQLVLIGHSMGGLVARSALAQATDDDAAWLKPVTHLFCLGAPHLGAPLESWAWNAGRLLDRLPFTAPFGGWLKARSIGIKQLRHGHLRFTDGVDEDLDAVFGSAAGPCPRPAHVRYGFIGSSLGPDPEAPLARLLGDGLVRLDSARAAAMGDADWASFTGLHHIRLSNDRRVYEQLRVWLRA